jgi:hypothetical protein
MFRTTKFIKRAFGVGLFSQTKEFVFPTPIHSFSSLSKLNEIGIYENGYSSYRYFSHKNFDLKFIEEFNKLNNKIQMDYLLKNTDLFRIINQQTTEMCKFMITLNPNNIEYVKKQTPELCMMAMDNDIYAFKFIRNEYQTEDVCLYMISKIKQFENKQTEILNTNGNKIEFQDWNKIFMELFNTINYPSEKVAFEAVKQFPKVIKLFENRKNLFYESCFWGLIENDPHLIQYINFPKDDVCYEVIEKDILTYLHLKNPSHKIKGFAIECFFKKYLDMHIKFYTPKFFTFNFTLLIDNKIPPFYELEIVYTDGDIKEIKNLVFHCIMDKKYDFSINISNQVPEIKLIANKIFT